MLLLALLLPPLALYLLLLGWINRRSRPVLIGGAWDFAGVLFALSGFLLVVGPALLGSLDEQSRWFWLLGESESAQASSAGAETQLGRPSPDELGQAESVRGWSSQGWTTTLWIVIRVFYFIAVAGGAAFLLWRSRRLTSIYNVDPLALFPALEQAFQRLGLSALRTGHSFRIGGRAPAVDPTLASPNTMLHVDVFPAMRHITLRWAPADSPVRREVEQELTHALAATTTSEQEPIQGGCLSVVGVALFALALVAAGLLILIRFYVTH